MRGRSIEIMNQGLYRKEFVKIIAGMSNRDPERVLAIVQAAAASGAHAADIAADAELVALVRRKVDLPLFVSASEPALLQEAAAAGADAVELDYDDLYREKRFPSSERILNAARETRERVPREVLLSVTISGTLPVDEQPDLAVELQKSGVDILQTEGRVGAGAREKTPRGYLEAALDAMVHTQAVRAATTLPILASGGVGSLTAPYTIVSGADGVGVGSNVTRYDSKTEMMWEITAIISALRELKKDGHGIRP